MTPDAGLVDRLRDRLVETMAPLLAGTRRVALLDYPDYSNVGDSALWIGALRLLESFGLEPVYVASHRSYDRRALARALRDGMILLAGGGNFGDLWEAHQTARERVVRDFPDNRVVQLPQSVHFESAERLERAVRVLDAHPAFTLIVRDRRSLERARRAFRSPALLSPDLAFALGTLPRPAPSRDVLWQSRSDREGVRARAGARRAVSPCDWGRTPRTPAAIAARRLLRLAERAPWTQPWLQGAIARLTRRVAGERLRAGCRLLASGRLVVTNRLHGHILCLLLGVPHVISDTAHAKIRDFYETWTASSPLATFCASEEEALACLDRGAPASATP